MILLFPELRNYKLQHTARNAASFIRDEETVFQFCFARVHICHFETRNHRVTVPQQTAQDPRDLRFYKHFFARRCFHLGNGLPGLDKITDGVQVAENTLCRRMEHPLGGIAANDTRNASVGGRARPPG